MLPEGIISYDEWARRVNEDIAGLHESSRRGCFTCAEPLPPSPRGYVEYVFWKGVNWKTDQDRREKQAMDKVVKLCREYGLCIGDVEDAVNQAEREEEEEEDDAA